MIERQPVMVLISAGAEWRALFPHLVENLPERSPLAECPYGQWFEAVLHQQRVIFLHGGWGKVAAAASTEYAISRWQPGRLINLGTCGGFAGRIQAGEILQATETLIYDIIEQMGDPQAAIQKFTCRPRWDAPLGNLPFPLHPTRLISADRDILAQEIPQLIEKFDAVAADWESGAIAWVAKRHNLPCLILRGVSDLVSPAGGEAYGAREIFQERSREIMARLMEALPGIIAALCTAS